MLRSLRFGLRRLFNHDAAERELADEVQHLLEMTAEAHVRRGLPRDEAMRRARAEFGAVESVKEQVRTSGWEAAVESFWRDLRYACRGMARTPVFTLIVLATLALGIGVTTAMFSVLNAVLLRPLPYADAGRLTLLWTDDIKRGLHQEPTAYLTITDWQAQATSFEAIGFFSAGRATIGSGPAAERTRAAMVSGNLFQVLGVAPALGRAIGEDEERAAAPVAVISHSLWTRRFASDPHVLGQALVLDEWQAKGDLNTLTIVGVMPAGFFFADRATDIWVPATTYWRWQTESTERYQGWARRWTAIGRLRDGASVEDARDDLARVGRHLDQVHPSTVPDFPGFAVTLVPMLDSIAGVPLQRALWLLMAAVGVVLVVACANVAGLLLARGAARQQEFTMRRALGASRVRLVRQQLIESLALAALGGLAGAVLAVGLTRIITTLADQRLPRLEDGAIDTRVLVFAGLAAMVSAIVFGVFPALRATAAERGMATERFHVARPRGFLLVAECALAVVLLVGAGLLLRSLALVRAVDPGFDPQRALLTRIQFPAEARTAENVTTSSTDRAISREQVQQVLLERVTALPGVEAAGLIDDMFVTGAGNESIAFPGMDPAAMPPGELLGGAVSPEFFPALGVPLRAGRHLRRDDALAKIRALYAQIQPHGMPLEEKARRSLAEPVVVNEAFVQRYLSGTDPIGRRFCIDPTAKTYWFEIVGVVGDLHRQGLERAAIPQFFGPYTPVPSGRVDLLVRTRGNPLAAAASVKEAVAAIVPGVVLPQTGTLDAALGDFSAQRRLQTLLLASFAALALVLAAIGIYGMVHYAVARRTREIGVRIAIGARPLDLFGRVMIDGLRWPLIGVVAGLIAAAAVTRLMAHLLFGVDASDPITFAAVALAFLVTACAACLPPARRATRVDAIAALRVE